MNEKFYRVLIIEDSAEDRLAYRRRIAADTEREYLFWETGSGEDGLRLYREVVPDCILLDYHLPDLDGLEFLDRLQDEGNRADVAVIMLTGKGNEAIAVRAMKKGADDYLIKGLGNEGLRQAVQSAIAKQHLRRQIAEQRQELERLASERIQLIAALEQQAASLMETNRRKDEFLAMLAHELRNPLAPIRNALQIMKQPDADTAVLQKVRDMAERQVQHMARLLDDLLDVSRFSRGRIELRKEAVDLAAIVSRTVEAVRSLVEERRHQLNVSLAAGSLRVEGDPTRLEQVLTNLLNNAAKYTDPGGCIWVAAERGVNEVVVRVRDTGIGIGPDALPHIFDLFVQAERRLDRSQGGIGIGLTLVKKLVELHGGRIEATSAGLGRGSEFVVRLLELSDPNSSEPARACSENKDGSLPRRSVLVVDDNQDAADSLALLLRLSGQEVRAAYDGASALAQAKEFRPSLVFLDIGMPGMDGYEVARRVRGEPCLAGTVLVALTGWGQDEDRRRSTEAGFDHHLVKPVEPKDLEELLADSKPTKK